MEGQSQEDQVEIPDDEVLQQGEVVGQDHSMACIFEIRISLRTSSSVPIPLQNKEETDENTLHNHHEVGTRNSHAGAEYSNYGTDKPGIAGAHALHLGLQNTQEVQTEIPQEA